MNLNRSVIVLLIGALLASGCSAVWNIDGASYQPVEVDDVRAELGMGSPAPVLVDISGTLPDTCAQLALVRLEQDGETLRFSLSTMASNDKKCFQDPVPFRLQLPLNALNLPAGTYSVVVNGISDIFTIETGSSAVNLPDPQAQVLTEDILVDSVNIEIGTGSPIPVYAVVGLNLPNTCAQLGEIRLTREGNAFYVRLISNTISSDGCVTDSIPYRAMIPLNIIDLPGGPYEVIVNGSTASFDPAAGPAMGAAEP